MTSPWQALLEHAERVVEGPELNAVAHALRAENPGLAGYEIVVPPTTRLEDLRAELVPRLRAHLASRRGPASSLFVWMWVGERAHGFRADVLLTLLAEPAAPRLLLGPG